MSETKPLSPGDCVTMNDVRAGVDAADRDLVRLLARRFAYMDAAARIKDRRESVRDEARKAQVIANVAAQAAGAGLPVDAITRLWDDLIEASIAYELARWDEING